MELLNTERFTKVTPDLNSALGSKEQKALRKTNSKF